VEKAVVERKQRLAHRCLTSLTGKLRVALAVTISVGKRSSIKQLIIMDAETPYLTFDTRVDWHENRRFLKVEFATTIRASEATYEVPVGCLSLSLSLSLCLGRGCVRVGLCERQSGE
jgi:alpha-mannosidase